MGLYDIVQCKKPLPDGFEGAELQTKDFEAPYLERYTIDDDGRLYKEAVWYANGHGNDRADTKFHGVLNFYGFGAEDDWHEYSAKFTDGQLVEIELVIDS